MRASSDGNASTFEIERLNPPTALELVFSPVKGDSFCSDLVSPVALTGVFAGRHVLHNARNEQRGLTNVQRS